MSPSQTQKFNTAFGSLFLVIGLAGWGIAGYFAATPNEPKPTPVTHGLRSDPMACMSTLRDLGFQPRMSGDSLVATQREIKEPQSQLERATIAMTSCRLELAAFCMGEACDEPGVSMTLKRSDPSKSGTQEAAGVGKPAAAARPTGGSPQGPSAAPQRPATQATPAVPVAKPA